VVFGKSMCRNKPRVSVKVNKQMSGADMAMLGIVSVALTIPFICYMKKISQSLQIIAEKQGS